MQLFDPDEEARTAVAQVESHADPEWLQYAYTFTSQYLATHEFMFVDDLWDAGLTPTREDRALGAVFQRLARRGIMTKSGTYRPSKRSHMTEKPVWRSLIWASSQ
jgi:hypothetical protein